MGVQIIAEAGVNHNGSIKLAKKLIDVAVEAKVDYIKFQTFRSENVVSKAAKQADYQKQNLKSIGNDSQLKMLKKLELTKEAHYELIDYCTKKRIKFLSTAFDLESIDFLKNLSLGVWKIPSGEITNLPYLRKIGGFHEKIILSTGMSNMKEIEQALSVLIKAGTLKSNITLLHCNTEYPTPYKDVNLYAMKMINEEFDIDVGYSDHTLGFEVPIAAVALGATIIEKHITLSKQMDGPDHKASLEPKELITMVRCLRNIEYALGSGEKVPSPSESKNISIARKSIHTSKNLPKGIVIEESDLIMKRPGDGISPMELEKVIGKKTKRILYEDEKISWEDLE